MEVGVFPHPASLSMNEEKSGLGGGCGESGCISASGNVRCNTIIFNIYPFIEGVVTEASLSTE